jgi:hypothetical protein
MKGLNLFKIFTFLSLLSLSALSIASASLAENGFEWERKVVIKRLEIFYGIWFPSVVYHQYVIRALDSEGANCHLYMTDGGRMDVTIDGASVSTPYSTTLEGTFDVDKSKCSGTYSSASYYDSTSRPAQIDDFKNSGCRAVYPYSGSTNSVFDDFQGSVSHDAEMTEIFTITKLDNESVCIEPIVTAFDHLSDDSISTTFSLGARRVEVGGKILVNGNRGLLKSQQRKSVSGMIGWTTELRVSTKCK